MSRARIADHSQLPGRPAGADRLASMLRLLRWPVLIAWVLVLVVLFPLARSLSGVTNGTAAANLPASAPSTRIVQLEQAPGQPDVDAATVVFARAGGLTAADLTAVAAARGAVAGLAGHVQGLGAPGPVHPRRHGPRQTSPWCRRAARSGCGRCPAPRPPPCRP